MILRPKPEVRNDGNSSGPRKLRPQIKILRYRRCQPPVEMRVGIVGYVVIRLWLMEGIRW
jgi:hypothetical protein